MSDDYVKPDPEPTRTPREIVVIAALGLVSVTLASVVGLVYSVVISGESTAALVSIASIGVGSLATLAGAAGASKRRSGDSS